VNVSAGIETLLGITISSNAVQPLNILLANAIFFASWKVTEVNLVQPAKQ